MAGLTAPAVLGRVGLDLVPMYFELDGTFPHHEANPIEPANLEDLRARVLAEGADIGLAFDGDADRCFLVDEKGRPVSPSTLTALIATRELGKEPGAVVIHNLITSRAVPEMLAEHERYDLSGEINSTVTDQAAVLAELEQLYGGREDVSTDRLDGLTVSHPDWWFNVRPSNTEPLLRLNAEGRDLPTMERVRDDALSLIRNRHQE
jgi:phosphomannomutase